MRENAVPVIILSESYENLLGKLFVLEMRENTVPAIILSERSENLF